MVKCPNCGEENPPKFRLCGYCGTPLASAAALPAHEVRKTVTLIFSDLKDSTALGERMDSEALHDVKERYFGAMAAEIQRHGGKIEKYIGDAIMAVFGLPRAHEDDALRAVRAAAAMRTVLGKLNQDLKQRFGVELANRTGVNTGEVVAIDDPSADQKLATGDAVNVTARLEQAAPTNEIYIGEVTYRLVRDAVRAEPVEPLALKGKSQPVPAYRLVTVHGQEGNVRHHDAPVVGRDDELVLLMGRWHAALAERRARLVTVIGDAGVGKTRLVREVMHRLNGSARIVSGRCLPYGDGITFWPLRGLVVEAAGIRQDDTPEQAHEKVLACVGDQEVADRLASATGLSAETYPLHDINWAARKFLQALAAQRPVVALIDDIHWAEPAFLDLLESVVESVEDAAVLLLATARHELLEERPQWGEGERLTRLVLQPLGDQAVAQVVTNLLGSAGLSPELVERVIEAAEGNPLYVEQMLSMLIDRGVVRRREGRWVALSSGAEIEVPPTIQALMEARLDRLERGERATAEPAAVIGLEFQRQAVQSLAPPPVRDSIDEKLQALSRKHFIRPAVGDPAEVRYRFDHHLVRDAVYNGLLKRTRATLHAEFVKWADEFNAGSDRGREFEEILGYHLEQAYKYLGELGPIDETGEAIGRDGAQRLASAARRAYARGDMHAAANLMDRAIALLPSGTLQRGELLPELGEILVGLGDFQRAREIVLEARSIAARFESERLMASSQLIELLMRMFVGDRRDAATEALPTPSQLIPVLEREAANSELAIAWRLVVFGHGIAGRYESARRAAERSVEHARLAGNGRLVARTAANLADFALLGPTPVRQAIAICEKLMSDGLSDRQVECTVLCRLAQLRAMNGELDVARRLCEQGRAGLRDLGEGVFAAATGIDLALIELLGGDISFAEQELRSDYEFLERKGETYYLSTMAALLSRLAREQGRDEEALRLSVAAEAASAEDDFDSQALWRAARAPILARAGQLEEAEALARAAVELVRRSEAPVLQADALSDLAVVLNIAGKAGEARRTLDEAISLYAQKGNVAATARSRQWSEGSNLN
jgi:class 3 adenylate cyclase/tetratricopeptide (TPR) repeat protein/type II secretory pathway predicted ATPase ExeA